jgi:hypothetical protein
MVEVTGCRPSGPAEVRTMSKTRTNLINATLATAAAAALLHLAEEEKLAHDIYMLASDTHGSRIFSNIAASQTRHESAMVGVLANHGIADPTTSTPGKFNDSALQALYDTLSERVLRSSAEALKVGQLIERTDIEDLNAALAADMPADARRVLQSLLRGSRNHLRAFTYSSAA